MVSVDEMGRLSAAGPLLAIVVPDTVRTDMRLVGELEDATKSVLAVLIEQQIATGHPHVHIDLSGLEFCDVAGLRALLHASRRLTAAGGQLTLTQPRAILNRTAAICGFSTELGLPPTAASSQASGPSAA
jgi:anti-sigma B factor antagonist